MGLSTKELATDVAKLSAKAMVASLSKKSAAAYVRGYNFMVSIDDSLYSFMKVDGMEASANVSYYAEGGYNIAGVPRRNPMVEERTLTLSYGCCKKNSDLDKMDVGSFLKKNVMVVVLGENLKSTKHVIYTFEGCYIKSINYGSLDASRSEILINSIQIAYTGMQIYEALY